MGTAVVVADGQRLFADALTRVLHEQADLDVSPRYALTGRAAVKEATDFKAEVLLIDYWIMEMRGPAATRMVLKRSPDIRVLFLAEFYIGPGEIEEARACGALGFVPKNAALDHLLAAVRAAAGANHHEPSRMARAPSVTAGAPGSSSALASTSSTSAPPKRDEEAERRLGRLITLTDREIQVLQLLSEGFTTPALAKELSITVGTLKNHMHKIITKTGALTTLDAICMAEVEGFISPGDRSMGSHPTSR